MNKNSPYAKLQWRVDYKDALHPWWEPIAAFNSDRVADKYASDCHRRNGGHASYRMVERKGSKWTVKATYGD